MSRIALVSALTLSFATGCVPVDTTSLTTAAVNLLDDVHTAVSQMLVLWVFGTVLLALLTPRMEKLELEIAARPMRSLAMGLVTLIVGAGLAIGLCVTVIGIPVALAGVIALVLAAYAGICAVLATLGGALVGHRTANAYIHLAVGCLVLLIAGAVPVVGELFAFLVAMTGLGAVIATRGAGLWPKPRGHAEDFAR